MEQEAMPTDNRVQINWLRVNVPTIVSILGAVVTVIVYVNKLDTRITVAEATNAAQKTIIQANTASLALLSNIPFRVGQTESDVDKVNTRVDRSYDTIVSALDVIRRDINDVSTKVEVQSSKIDDLTERLKNTARARSTTN